MLRSLPHWHFIRNKSKKNCSINSKVLSFVVFSRLRLKSGHIYFLLISILLEQNRWYIVLIRICI